MSWLELDDGILDHPKFVLAADKGGSAAIHMWLGLRAYCGKQLTDGSIPKFMLKKVSGPEKHKDREHALAVLVEVNLVEDHGDFYQLHDYLEHSKSRETILEARKRNKARQAKWRGGHPVSNGVTDSVTNALVAPSVTKPSPLLSSPLLSKIPLLPSVVAPQGADRDIGLVDLESFSVDISVISSPEKPRGKKPKVPQWRRFPPDFEPDDSHRKLAAELGLNLAAQLAEIRDHEFKSPKSDPAATLRTWLRNAVKFGAPTLGAPRVARLDPRNEAQDRNAEHEARADIRTLDRMAQSRRDYELGKRLAAEKAQVASAK